MSVSSHYQPPRRLAIMVVVYKFFSECFPIYPLYAVMFADRGGLSTAAISVLFLVWIAVAMVAEVPTGVLGDRLSRRVVLGCSPLLTGLAFVSWWLWPVFAGFLLGFVLWGVGYSLQSGCFQAYVYDELAAAGCSPMFARVYFRAEAAGLVGQVVAFISASVVGPSGYVTLLIVSAIMAGLSGLSVVALPPETTAGQRHHEVRPGALKHAMGQLRSHPQLRLVVVMTALVCGVGAGLEEFPPLYYRALGLGTQWVPLVLVTVLVISTALTMMARRWPHLSLTRNLLLVVGLMLLVLITSWASLPVALAGVVTYQAVIKLSQVLAHNSLQECMTGSARATVGSVQALGAEVVAMVISAGYGLGSRVIGHDVGAMRLVALVVAFTCLVAWGSIRRGGGLGTDVQTARQVAQVGAGYIAPKPTRRDSGSPIST